ncbi:mitofilin family membrane protein, partial [Falsiroseomonas oryzae]|uniref:mitofilin family membrane protein n=1 Tax=Falsiroseomonas oryzae TaxID=2766473 RepID=UPI0022EB29DB
ALDAVRAALEGGRPLGPALAGLQNPPEALARFANAAPPTEAALRLSFEEAVRNARGSSEPAAGSGVMDSAVTRLSGLLTVRRGEEMVLGDAAAIELERARRALEAGDLEGAVRILSRLSPAAREAMRGWIAQAEALVAARAAIRQMAAG